MAFGENENLVGRRMIFSRNTHGIVINQNEQGIAVIYLTKNNLQKMYWPYRDLHSLDFDDEPLTLEEQQLYSLWVMKH